MKGNYNIFYTPEKQYPGMPHGEMCGDFMPFFWKGTYYLFYLYKYCVYAVETRDFVNFGEPYLVCLLYTSPYMGKAHIIKEDSIPGKRLFPVCFLTVFQISINWILKKIIYVVYYKCQKR